MQVSDDLTPQELAELGRLLSPDSPGGTGLRIKLTRSAKAVICEGPKPEHLHDIAVGALKVTVTADDHWLGSSNAFCSRRAALEALRADKRAGRL